VGKGLLIVEATRTHTDLSHLVGLLWKRDRPDTETSIGQHTTFTTDRHTGSRGIRNRNPSKQAAADPNLRLRGHWDRLKNFTEIKFILTNNKRRVN
jgi:hypothetical protein